MDRLPGWAKRIFAGLVATVVTSVLGLLETIFKLRALIFKEFGVYIPTLSMVSFLAGATACVFVVEQLLRRQRSTITGDDVLALPHGSRRRRLAWAALALWALFFVCAPTWFWYRHYNPRIPSSSFYVYIDPFDIKGWDQEELVDPVMMILRRELGDVLPDARVVLLKTPTGIAGQQERVDWACGHGARVVIYASGDPDHIRPHVYPCSEQIRDRFPSLTEDTGDWVVGRVEASFAVRSTPRYAFLEPARAEDLCIVDSLTPHRVEYMALLALGLVCLYEDVPGLNTADLYLRAHDLLSRAVQLVNDTSDCNLSYCEVMRYLGNSAIWLAYSEHDSTVALRLLHEADTAYSRVIRMRPGRIDAMVGRAYALVSLHRDEEALVALDIAADRAAEDSSVTGKSFLASSLLLRAAAMGGLNRTDEELRAYDDLVGRFGQCQDSALQEQVETALFNKAVILGQLGRGEEAIRAYDSVISRSGGAHESAAQDVLARAFVNKGVTLTQLGRCASAIQVLDDALQRFGKDPRWPLRPEMASALVGKGIALGQSGQNVDAVRVFEDVVGGFGDDREPAVRAEVGRALVNKAVALNQLTRLEEGIQVCEDVVRRFADDHELELRECVARAMYNKGLTLNLLGRNDEAIQAYEEVVQRFGHDKASELRRQVAKAQLNEGRALFMLGRSDEAIRALCDSWRQRELIPPEGLELLKETMARLGMRPDDCR
jgi:tetratricopeptide (TPR) repeat protein